MRVCVWAGARAGPAIVLSYLVVSAERVPARGPATPTRLSAGKPQGGSTAAWYINENVMPWLQGTVRRK